LKEQLRTDILGSHPDGSITLHAKAWAVRGIVPYEPLLPIETG